MSTLVSVGAHPDDASIFWGGTIARHVAEGWTAVSITVDDGRGSPHSFEMTKDELVVKRADELRWESLRLGARNEHLSIAGVKTPENRAAAIAGIAAVLRESKPDKVIIHNLADAHQTHVMVARCALQAIVQVADEGGELPEVWQGDGWEPVHYPDVRVDVTPYMNQKMAAISQHGSQIFDTPYLMGAWGLCLYRAGFAASHEITDAACVFAEAYRRIAPDEVRAAAAANRPEA